jgi:hypothetical protein
MTGFILHQGATVICMHAGQAQPTTANPRVKVGGQPIVTQGSQHAIAACSLSGSGSTPPCTTAQFVTAATRVRAGGQPVLLQDSQAVCTPTGTGLQIPVCQMRVRGQ